jgi:hypothetical protein
MWEAAIAAVPGEGAVEVPCKNSSQAGNRAHSLRRYLTKIGRGDEFVTKKVGDKVYIAYADAVAVEEGPEEAE